MESAQYVALELQGSGARGRHSRREGAPAREALENKVFALGEKTVNQRKHEIVCKLVAHGQGIEGLVWYKRSSDLGGHLEAFLPDTMQSDSHPLGT